MVNMAAQVQDGVPRTQTGDHPEEASAHGPAASAGAQDGAAHVVRMALSGFVGVVTVTVLNETARRLVPHAPRMDVIGERALRKTLRAAKLKPPQGRALYRWTMAGDLLSNTLYYSMVGGRSSQNAWRRGAVLGLAAGVGAIVLPRPLGLGRQPGERVPRTQLLTASWYLTGGLAAAAAARLLRSRD